MCVVRNFGEDNSIVVSLWKGLDILLRFLASTFGLKFESLLLVMAYYQPGSVWGVGRGACIKRSVSNPGYGYCSNRSSSPIRADLRSPPPLNLSPIRPTTPKGVYTQVQKGEKEKESSDKDSNNTDDLFNDSFDIDEFELAESGLTQDLPKCNISEDKPVESKTKEVETMQTIKEAGSDVLAKVIDQTIFQDMKKGNILGCQDSLINVGQQNHSLFEDTTYRPFTLRMLEPATGMDLDKDKDSDVNVKNEVPMSGMRQSSHLSAEKIRELLLNLTPDPSVNTTLDFNNVSSVPSNSAMEASWGVQIPVRLDDSADPVRLVPVATDTLRGADEKTNHATEIAAVVQHVRHATVKLADGNVQATGMESHDFPMVSKESVKSSFEAVKVGDELGFKKFRITIPELILPIRDQSNVTLECGEIVQFVMVARHKYSKSWTVPSKQRFHDILNQIDNRFRREHMEYCKGLLAWNYEWNGVEVMGLRAVNTAALHAYRTAISDVIVGDYVYNTYPKVCLPQEIEISLFLKKELRCLDLEFVPESLFENNCLLEGNIAVRYSKNCYNGSSDVNNCLDGTLVLLEGDRAFVRSVSKYPDNYLFRLGSAQVKIQHNAQDQCQEQLGKKESPESMEPDVVNELPQTRFANRWGQSVRQANETGLPKPVPAVHKKSEWLATKAIREMGRGRGRNRTWIRGIGSLHKRHF